MFPKVSSQRSAMFPKNHFHSLRCPKPEQNKEANGKRFQEIKNYLSNFLQRGF